MKNNPFKKLSLGIMVLSGILILGQISYARISNTGGGGVSSPVGVSDGGTGLTAVGASSTVLTTNGSVTQWNKLATSQLTNDSGFGANAFSYTASNNFGFNGQSTTTFMSFFGGLAASSTSQIAYASTTALSISGSGYLTGLTSTLLTTSATGLIQATTSIRIAGNSFIGIATSTPLATLHVNGSIVSEEASTTAPATTVINWAVSNQQRILIPNSITSLTFNNGQAGAGYRLVVCQGNAGSKTIVWPTSVLWSGGTAPTLTTTANKCDLITFTASYATTSQLWFMGGSVLNF